jgi:hypothetical protein
MRDIGIDNRVYTCTAEPFFSSEAIYPTFSWAKGAFLKEFKDVWIHTNLAETESRCRDRISAIQF